MAGWDWLAVGLGALVVIWLAGLLLLLAIGRRDQARALLRFIPDCAVLLRRLSAEGYMSRRTKILIALTVVYLAFPIDAVPDFIPVLGHLDDALLLLVTLRMVLRQAPPGRVEELWPGPRESLDAVLRIAGRGG